VVMPRSAAISLLPSPQALAARADAARRRAVDLERRHGSW